MKESLNFLDCTMNILLLYSSLTIATVFTCACRMISSRSDVTLGGCCCSSVYCLNAQRCPRALFLLLFITLVALGGKIAIDDTDDSDASTIAKIYTVRTDPCHMQRANTD